MKSKLDDTTLMYFLRVMMSTAQQEQVRTAIKLRWNFMGV